MAIRIGNVELTGVQTLHADEGRSLVEQDVPGKAGSVFQDLGRKPIAISMEGVVIGEEAFSALEDLRQAYTKAKPLQFAADIAVGTDLTSVLIEHFQVRQVAGYRSRYRFAIKIREYTEPPEPPFAGIAAVNADIAMDADGWAADALAGAGALQDPGSLPGALAGNPGLLGHLSGSDIGLSITRAAGSLTGGDFAGILGAVGSIDPAKVVGVVNAIRESGSLGEFVGKMAEQGVDLLEEMSGVDLGVAGTLVRGLAGAADFVRQLKRVSKEAGDLIEDLRNFDPLAGARAALQGEGP